MRDGDPRHGPLGTLADRLAGGDRHRLVAHQGADHRRARRPHPRRPGRGPNRARRRLPGRLRRLQGRDHARARRLRHHRRCDRRRPRCRRVRDLHRRRRGLQRRSAAGARGAQARPGLVRGDARDVLVGRRGAAAARGRVRAQPRRQPALPELVQGWPRYARARRGRDDGAADGHSSHARLRGARHPDRPLRRAGGRRARVQRALRRERERRHDHPERAGLRRPQGRPLVHGRPRRPAFCHRGARAAAGRQRLRRRRGRQGLDRRRRHAQPPGRRREGVPDPGREPDQHRDDLHLADQDLLRDRRRNVPAAVQKIHEAFGLGADAVVEEDPSGEHRPRVTS